MIAVLTIPVTAGTRAIICWIVYQVTISSRGVLNMHNIMATKGLSKYRYNNHKSSFNISDYAGK